MEVSVVLTMDCEPAHTDVSQYGLSVSDSGPGTNREGERSIRGYVEIAAEYGYTPTLFVHPEVARDQPEFLLNLQDRGACLGLHVHPYKLDADYKFDLGAYPATEQREILERAVDEWTDALGQRPNYFRGGRYSANDDTFGILCDLGFEGGSLSNVGRVLPQHYAVWAGAEPYPHRAHEGFRQVAGDSEFVEVPTLGDVSRPIEGTGDADESMGYEWLYVPSRQYEHEAVVRNLLARFEEERPERAVVVTNTHNDKEYSDPSHHATQKLRTICSTLTECSEELDVTLRDDTMASVVERVRNRGG